jgi:microcompartment protein CcmK/EutM
MRLGRVTGTVVATIKHEALAGRKLLMVQPIDPFGKDVGEVVIALDQVQAGTGDRVLLLEEGNSSRQILQYENAPVRCLVVGIIDHVDLAAEPASV